MKHFREYVILSFLFLLSIPFTSIAQKVKLNSFDDLSSQQRIEMEAISILNAQGTKLSLLFTASSSEIYFELSGFGTGAATIDVDNIAILKLANNSIISIKSISLQSFEPGLKLNRYLHKYFISKEDVIKLSENLVVNIRKFMFTDFVDYKISVANANKIRKSSSLFLRKLLKSTEQNSLVNTKTKETVEMPPQPIPNMQIIKEKQSNEIQTPEVVAIKNAQSIMAKDAALHVGDNVIICDKVQITRFYESEQAKATILDFQSQRSVKKFKAIIWQDDLRKFGPIPKAFFTARDVCITGTIYLYNNEPYIRIKEKNQIRITSPIGIDEMHLFAGDTISITGVLLPGEDLKNADNDYNTLNLKSENSKYLGNVMVETSVMKDLPDLLKKNYMNKPLSIKGKVSLLENKPYVVISQKEQVKLLPLL